VNAIHALSQLSYGPGQNIPSRRRLERRVKDFLCLSGPRIKRKIAETAALLRISDGQCKAAGGARQRRRPSFTPPPPRKKCTENGRRTLRRTFARQLSC
jgi:hypothetical protein